LEIILKEVHVGPCRTVVTLQIGNDRSADDFLYELIASNPNAAKSLQTSMATITSIEEYRNRRKFKRVAEGIYEIKVPGIRLYCFKEQLEGMPSKLIVATNGGRKNTKREQDSDIKQASVIRERFLTLKNLETTKLRYIKIKQ
jgi:hypothetical protein